MSILAQRRGLAGWLMALAAVVVWIVVVAMWYRPASVLDPTDQTNLFIVLWWTIVCGACVFVGIRFEKIRAVR